MRSVGEEVLLIEEEQQIPEKVTEEELKPKDVIEVVKKIVGKEGGKPICFWLPNQSWLELLMCVSKGRLDSPLLFHYDVWNTLRPGRKVKQVESISFSNFPRNNEIYRWSSCRFDKNSTTLSNYSITTT